MLGKIEPLADTGQAIDLAISITDELSYHGIHKRDDPVWEAPEGFQEEVMSQLKAEVLGLTIFLSQDDQ